MSDNAWASLAPIEEIDLDHRPLQAQDLVGREQPLVMRGLTADWPLVQAAKNSDTRFAVALSDYDNGSPVNVLLMAPECEGVVGYAPGMEAFNFEHHRVSITQGLKRLAAYSRQADPVPGLAMQSALVAECLPDFAKQHALAFLHPDIQPRIWIGNRVTTPAHYDESHNIASVVCGRRRFTLFAPEQVRNLYVGPLDFAPTGTAMSIARLDRPDDRRFPRLRQALEHAQAAELSPGDAIYIPPMWWHHVTSLERINALVNYWWKSVPAGGAAPATGLPALLHCILALKSLPKVERLAWRSLLDHYVFDDQDPAEHLPEKVRGVLGSLTPEVAEQLRQRIRKSL